MPRITAEVIAPPTPWTKRAATSSAWLSARPHSSEANVNSPMPEQEHPAAADQVAEAPREQQQPAEGDQVGVHDPRERGAREVQLFLDRGQRDVDHRHVEHDHQHPRAEHVERHPARVALRRGLGRLHGSGRRVEVGRACRAHSPITPASRSISSRVPCSRAATVSCPSRNTPCSVSVSAVPSPVEASSIVATETEMRSSLRNIS